MKTKKKKGGDYEEESTQDCLQDIRDSTSYHDRDGDVPVNKKVPAAIIRHIGMNSSQ